MNKLFYLKIWPVGLLNCDAAKINLYGYCGGYITRLAYIGPAYKKGNVFYKSIVFNSPAAEICPAVCNPWTCCPAWHKASHTCIWLVISTIIRCEVASSPSQYFCFVMNALSYAVSYCKRSHSSQRILFNADSSVWAATVEKPPSGFLNRCMCLSHHGIHKRN